jgi:hypothetical protein
MRLIPYGLSSLSAVFQSGEAKTAPESHRTGPGYAGPGGLADSGKRPNLSQIMQHNEAHAQSAAVRPFSRKI